jgi:hypothetical protein
MKLGFQIVPECLLMKAGEHEVFRDIPWPFPEGRFPADLGAVTQLTVLNGEVPACLVVHASDNSWLVGDGVADPNAEGAVAVAGMTNVAELNSSVNELASLPPGWEAARGGLRQAWERHPHQFPDEG